MKSENIIEAVSKQLEESSIPMAHLARRTGLSASCLYNLKNGKTKWPRGVTMDCVTQILGLELKLVKRK